MPQRKPPAAKRAVRKPRPKKGKTVRAKVRKPKRKQPAVKRADIEPRPKLEILRAELLKPERDTSIVKPVAIKQRRTVETSDALMFPSGRPIRKR